MTGPEQQSFSGDHSGTPANPSPTLARLRELGQLDMVDGRTIHDELGRDITDAEIGQEQARLTDRREEAPGHLRISRLRRRGDLSTEVARKSLIASRAHDIYVGLDELEVPADFDAWQKLVKDPAFREISNGVVLDQDDKRQRFPKSSHILETVVRISQGDKDYLDKMGEKLGKGDRVAILGQSTYQAAAEILDGKDFSLAGFRFRDQYGEFNFDEQPTDRYLAAGVIRHSYNERGATPTTPGAMLHFLNRAKPVQPSDYGYYGGIALHYEEFLDKDRRRIVEERQEAMRDGNSESPVEIRDSHEYLTVASGLLYQMLEMVNDPKNGVKTQATDAIYNYIKKNTRELPPPHKRTPNPDVLVKIANAFAGQVDQYLPEEYRRTTELSATSFDDMIDTFGTILFVVNLGVNNTRDHGVGETMQNVSRCIMQLAQYGTNEILLLDSPSSQQPSTHELSTEDTPGALRMYGRSAWINTLWHPGKGRLS